MTAQTTPCWTSVGANTGKGYRIIRWRGRNTYVHRLAYELRCGVIPTGMFVCHRCDNPGCTNPLHLFLGTASDNAIDRDRKGRGRNSRKTECPKGHPYTPENVHVRSGRRGRLCRTCGLAQMARRYQRIKAGERTTS